MEGLTLMSPFLYFKFYALKSEVRLYSNFLIIFYFLIQLFLLHSK